MNLDECLSLKPDELKHVGVIVQARTKSKRMPNKVFFPLGQTHILEHLFNRLLYSQIPTILAVPREEVDAFSCFAKRKKVELFIGSQSDVLDRYYQAAKKYKLKTIVRVTGDNPLTSIWGIYTCLRFHQKEKNELSFIQGLPYGAGCEVFEMSALEKAATLAKEPLEREHATQYFYRHPRDFKLGSLRADLAHYAPHLRVTIDTRADFECYRAWVDKLGLNQHGFLSLRKVIGYEFLF